MNDFNKTEFEKFAKILKNLEKANKVTIRFPLRNLYQSCVEQDSRNKINCIYFLQGDGLEIFYKLIEKFDNESILE